MARRKDVSPYYLAIKNYIHNELKLSRDDIREIIKDVVKQEVKHKLEHEGYLEQTVDSNVRYRLCQGGFDNQANWYIRKLIEAQIKDVKVIVNLKDEQKQP